MITKMVSAFLAGVLLVSPLSVSAQDDSLEHIVIEMASTPAEHAAIARYYLSKAEEARRETSRHEQMARAYDRGKISQRVPMRGHCLRLAESFRAVAEEYGQLAQLHDAESKRPQ